MKGRKTRQVVFLQQKIHKREAIKHVNAQPTKDDELCARGVAVNPRERKRDRTWRGGRRALLTAGNRNTNPSLARSASSLDFFGQCKHVGSSVAYCCRRTTTVSPFSTFNKQKKNAYEKQQSPYERIFFRVFFSVGGEGGNAAVQWTAPQESLKRYTFSVVCTSCVNQVLNLYIYQ